MKPGSFSGAILTGGQSRRMGRDKALIVVDGAPMAARIAGALRAAGAAEVLAVGGDAGALAALGLSPHADRHPGEGPLGGIVTALDAAANEVVVVVATDLVALTAETVRAVLEALDPETDAALAHTGRLEPLCGAWRRRAGAALQESFAAGERAVHAALTRLTVVTVPVDPATLRNANTPADLKRR